MKYENDILSRFRIKDWYIYVPPGSKILKTLQASSCSKQLLFHSIKGLFSMIDHSFKKSICIKVRKKIISIYEY